MRTGRDRTFGQRHGRPAGSTIPPRKWTPPCRRCRIAWKVVEKDHTDLVASCAASCVPSSRLPMRRRALPPRPCCYEPPPSAFLYPLPIRRRLTNPRPSRRGGGCFRAADAARFFLRHPARCGRGGRRAPRKPLASRKISWPRPRRSARAASEKAESERRGRLPSVGPDRRRRGGSEKAKVALSYPHGPADRGAGGRGRAAWSQRAKVSEPQQTAVTRPPSADGARPIRCATHTQFVVVSRRSFQQPGGAPTITVRSAAEPAASDAPPRTAMPLQPRESGAQCAGQPGA